MIKELKAIKKNLAVTLELFRDGERNYGYDLANERFYIKQALKQVNILLLNIKKRDKKNEKENQY